MKKRYPYLLTCHVDEGFSRAFAYGVLDGAIGKALDALRAVRK